jgi:hypothetical protein
MRARGVLGLLAIGIIVGAGSVYTFDRLAPGSLGQSLNEARRHSTAAIVALDSALERSGRLTSGLGRIKELAIGIQECANELAAIVGSGPSGSEEKKP